MYLELLVPVLILVVLAALAWRFGADSRFTNSDRPNL
jgi:hypothetical protein